MNIYEAVKSVRLETPMRNGNRHLWDALNVMQNFVFAYEKLAPNWDNVPGWVQHYAILVDGTVLMSETDIVAHDSGWVDAENPIGVWEKREQVILPLGIDWRLCKWDRPQGE